jgi:TP901 family phage tail tape measure protein
VTDRTVRVILEATVGQYKTALGSAAAQTEALNRTVKQTQQTSRQAFTTVGRDMLIGGGILAGGFLLATRQAMNFNAQMSQIQALSRGTSTEMQQLRAAALNAGQAIGFSANQTADAETELIKAGISVKDIMGGALTGALALAAAGQIDVASATETAAIAMTQFKLHGKDVPHIADLLAAGADKALGGVQDLSYALKSGGLVAAQFGLTIEDTVGTLAAFANAGLLGEQGGTTLRQMLLQLTRQAPMAREEMKRLGITLYDASGKFVGITNLAGQLQDKLGKVSEETRNTALATIFGAHSISGANVLYQLGAKGLQAWIDNVNASGFAMQQASGKMDNLKGDLSKLNAAFQTDLINGGSSATGALRGLTQGATEVVKAYGSLPPAVQGGATAIAGLAGSALLVGGAISSLAPKWQQLDQSLLNITKGAIGARGALKALGTATVVIAGLTTAFEIAGSIGQQFGRHAPGVNQLSESLVDLARTGTASGTVVKTFGKDLEDFKSQLHQTNDHSLWGWLNQRGADLNRFTGKTGNARQNIHALDSSLADLVQSGNGVVAAAALRQLGLSGEEAAKSLPKYADALAAVRLDTKLAGVSADILAGKISATGAKAAVAVSSIGAFVIATHKTKEEIKALSDEQTAWAQSFSGFADPLKVYTDTLTKAQDAENKRAQDQADSAKTNVQASVDAVTREYRNKIDAVRATKHASTATIRALQDQRDATIKNLKDGSASWQDYARTVTVSVSSYLTSLQKQVSAEQNWSTNLLKLSSRVSAGTLDELARMGIQGAPLVASLAGASDKELAKLDRLFATHGATSSAALAEQLKLAQPILTRIAGTLGQATADRLARALAEGSTTVAQIAAKYGIDLSDPIILAASRAKTAVDGTTLAVQNLIRAFAGLPPGLSTLPQTTTELLLGQGGHGPIPSSAGTTSDLLLGQGPGGAAAVPPHTAPKKPAPAPGGHKVPATVHSTPATRHPASLTSSTDARVTGNTFYVSDWRNAQQQLDSQRRLAAVGTGVGVG